VLPYFFGARLLKGLVHPAGAGTILELILPDHLAALHLNDIDAMGMGVLCQPCHLPARATASLPMTPR
jgi:hypothetical protein